ncbi:MAG: hypothetical protein U9Q27_03445 [Patescibacteria group bacterium]|nr:hypothetical protein [Patescibacteria group bacterium]
MCSICGIGFQKGNKISNSKIIYKILQKLLINGQARGKSATGIAIADNKCITVIKNNLPADKFIKTSEFKKILKQYIYFNKKENYISPIQIIGHCRMPTKGSPLNNENNHPIVTKSFVGVHNGVISNDNKLFNDHKNDFKRNGEVDSEIIFKLVEKYYIKYKNMPKAVQSANLELSGSKTYAFISTKNPYLLWLFKDNNPVSILHYKKIGIIIFASDEKYIVNATKGISLGPVNKIPIQIEEGLGIDLLDSTMFRFKAMSNFNNKLIGYV